MLDDQLALLAASAGQGDSAALRTIGEGELPRRLLVWQQTPWKTHEHRWRRCTRERGRRARRCFPRSRERAEWLSLARRRCCRGFQDAKLCHAESYVNRIARQQRTLTPYLWRGDVECVSPTAGAVKGRGPTATPSAATMPSVWRRWCWNSAVRGRASRCGRCCSLTAVANCWCDPVLGGEAEITSTC